MKPTDVLKIMEIIRMLCPYLKDMAARTDSPIDDAIVEIVCSLVLAANTDQKE